MVKRIWLFLLLTLLTANAFAQSATTATIRGKITTANGTAVPNAEVNAVNTQSGFVRTVNSRADGTYTLNGLTPGPYQIVVAGQGYEPKTQDVTVLVGQTLDFDVNMSQPTEGKAQSIEVATPSTQPATSAPLVVVEPAIVQDKTGVTTHVARRGETLDSMAADFRGKDARAYRAAIVEANPSLQADPDKLIAGKTYVIPS